MNIYSGGDLMAISKIILNGVTQMDVTQNTVASDNLLDDYIATGADGNQVIGSVINNGATGTSGARLFPDGSQVKLPGDSYTLNIVPDSTSATVHISDNGTDRTSQLTQITGVDKNNNPVVSYTYKLTNIQATHNLLVTIGTAVIRLYVKQNGSWIQYSKAYKKINGSWVEQDITGVFNGGTLYVKKN